MAGDQLVAAPDAAVGVLPGRVLLNALWSFEAIVGSGGGAAIFCSFLSYSSNVANLKNGREWKDFELPPLCRFDQSGWSHFHSSSHISVIE